MKKSKNDFSKLVLIQMFLYNYSWKLRIRNCSFLEDNFAYYGKKIFNIPDPGLRQQDFFGEFGGSNNSGNSET